LLLSVADLVAAEAPFFYRFEWPLLAEAGSKRKMARVGGKYDLHFYWHVTKVGLEVFVADDSLPMWRAVPLTSKSRLF
jgi:hypothetical protein